MKLRRRKKRRQGEQPGHKQQLREPLPPEQVDETIDYEIDADEVERFGLTPTGDFEVIQHIELPESPAHVTERRLTVYQHGDELTKAIPRQEQLGSDETSIKDNSRKHWIWCITASTFSGLCWRFASTAPLETSLAWLERSHPPETVASISQCLTVPITSDSNRGRRLLTGTALFPWSAKAGWLRFS